MRSLFSVTETLTLLVHQAIKAIINKKKKGLLSKEDKESLKTLLFVNNFDARDYFFAHADEKWLDWLWENRFLNILKQPEDTTSYSYSTPEIGYLVKVAEKKPKKVVEIINSQELATTKNKFRPELLDRLLRLFGDWKAEYIVQVLPKIVKQEWPKLMSPFGIAVNFSYQKIFKILFEAKKYDELLSLAGAVLAVKNKNDFKEKYTDLGDGTKIYSGDDNPFYISDLEQTEVFDYLNKIVEINPKYSQKAFELFVGIISSIAKLGKTQADAYFKLSLDHVLQLYEINFFKLTLPRQNAFRYEVKALLFTLKNSYQQLVNQASKKNDSFKKIRKTISKLPQRTKVAWRFQFFAYSQRPKIFGKELKDSLFLPFQDKIKKHVFELLSGAEYEQALQVSFNLFNDQEKKDYIDLVKEHFLQLAGQEKTKLDKNRVLSWGSRLFSTIRDDRILKKRQQELKKLGLVISDEYEPQATISVPVGARRIVSAPPIKQEDFNKIPIDQLIKKLTTDWAPENLIKLNKRRDFDEAFGNPINAEGVEKLIIGRIEQKFDEMVNNSPKFFDSNDIHPHYTYAFLKGVKNAAPQNLNAGYSKLIKLLKEILEKQLLSQDNNQQSRQIFSSWLADWRSVHEMIVELIKELLTKYDNKTALDFDKYREAVFEILKKLLYYPDPVPEDEDIQTSGFKVQRLGKPDMISDPFTMAINRVRGKAFEAFLSFIYLDGKRLKDDVKNFYVELIRKENTRAMMFMYGHHLSSFYFCARRWTKEKMLFGLYQDGEKDYFLKLAAIEGYLSQNIYKGKHLFSCYGCMQPCKLLSKKT